MRDLGRDLKQRTDGYIRWLGILGLAGFSVGVGKAFNWKIGVFVFILLVTISRSVARIKAPLEPREPSASHLHCSRWVESSLS